MHAGDRRSPGEVASESNDNSSRERRGRLKIFFGASVGVGKTYLMLESARGVHAAGLDVVVGYVETHGRIETERLITGLERLKAGKVHVHLRAGTPAETFFREPNLYALRELALRRTAERVEAAAREHLDRTGASKPWLARDRFMIAVAPEDQAEQTTSAVETLDSSAHGMLAAVLAFTIGLCFHSAGGARAAQRSANANCSV